MPELAEIEAYRDLIEKRCLDKTILRITLNECGGHARTNEIDDIVLDSKLISNPQQFIGRKLTGTIRKGKYLCWKLAGSKNTYGDLLFHCGMTGRFVIQNDKTYITYKSTPGQGNQTEGEDVGDDDDAGPITSFPPRFTKIIFHFSDNVNLSFSDSRRFARVRVLEDNEKTNVLLPLAPDPIVEMPNKEEFLKRFQTKGGGGSRVMKTLLLDQDSIVCGLGNYLVDECLLEAKIHPNRRANTLTPLEIERLRNAIFHICTVACESTVQNKEFPSHWLIHGRWDTPKLKKENPRNGVKEMKIGGRTTLFCPTIQKLGANSKYFEEKEEDANLNEKKGSKRVKQE